VFGDADAVMKAAAMGVVRSPAPMAEGATHALVEI
jgi:hypothetical protein